MYGDPLDDILGDGDFRDSWSARDLEDAPTAGDAAAGIFNAALSANATKGGGAATTPSGGVMGTVLGSPTPSTSSGGVQVGTPVTATTPAAAAPPTDDPALPLPDGAFRQNGSVFVQGESGPVQIYPIAGQWQTRGGVLARYITTYATQRAAGQTPTQAVQTAAQASGYVVPTTQELSAVFAQQQASQMAALAPAVGQQFASVVAPQLNALTALAVQQAYSQQATAEHREIADQVAFRQSVMNGITELLGLARSTNATLATDGPRRY